MLHIRLAGITPDKVSTSSKGSGHDTCLLGSALQHESDRLWRSVHDQEPSPRWQVKHEVVPDSEEAEVEATSCMLPSDCCQEGLPS